MEEEVAVSAPEQVATAAPEPEVNSPEVAEPPVEQVEEKKYSQAEIDAMIGKRLAREQRKWEREQAAKQTQPAPVEQFAEDSADALTLQKAEELIAKREAAKQHAQVLEQYHDREEAARDKYDDFEQVAYNPKLPVTETMAQTIQASEMGPDVIYWLGSNPKEAERIARLSPLLQAREIGKIEARLGANPPAKKTSTAPAPIAPVTARTASAPAYDTTDPRSVKSMSTSEWIEQERLRQIKKYEAQRRR